MGCDIHLYVEKYKKGKWVSADTWGKGKDYNNKLKVPYNKRFYTGRNYTLFSILADVRNGNGIPVIDFPRGLPIDVSPNVKKESDDWDNDGHSHSYFTVKELIEYNWTQSITLSGWVNGLEYFKWKRKSEWSDERGPESYNGDIYGGNIIKILETDLKKEIEKIKEALEIEDKLKNNNKKPVIYSLENEVEENLSNYYCHVEWNEPYNEICSDFWSRCMPRLFALGSPENVRIVFWFDS